MRYNLEWSASQYDPEQKITYPAFTAEVPGNVQYDYAAANGFGDIQFGDNVKQFEAIEDNWWIYSAKISELSHNGESLWFVAEGIDYIYDIFIDDTKLLSGEGMYTPAELDITAYAKHGSVIKVIIHPHPKREGAPVGRNQADQSCKPPFCYGWDWNPRLLVSGLWRDAYLETRGNGYIRSIEPFYTLNSALDTAEVSFVTDCDTSVTYTLFDAQNNIVYKGTSARFTVENIKLWWCNGQGEPYLYRWTAETDTVKREGFIGFRTVRLVQNTGAQNDPSVFPKSQYPAPITVELNGRRIFAMGSNWINPELFPGRVTEERLAELITVAADAGMNIFRIWGGSGINKPEFYDLCDKYGIMVWQEFMLACNNYIGTPEYLKVLEKEAVSILRQLRRHPGIIMWCGGNELFNDWSGMDEQSLALRLLNKLCYEQDPIRPFIFTSPVTGMGHGGYTFFDPGNYREVYEVFSTAHCTAYTEFGVPAMAPVEQLKRIIPEDELFPPRATDSWVAHHGFNAWVTESWVHPQMLKYYFGEPESLEEMVENSSWLQSEGYKAAFEEARRQWPHCSMAINWCFEEPWITAANNSLISYPLVKKPGYYAVSSAIRPIMASARLSRFSYKAGELFSAELWMLNNSPEEISDIITPVIEIDGTEYEQFSWSTGSIAALTNKMGPQLNFIIPKDALCGSFTLILRTEDSARESRYKLHLVSKNEVIKEKRLNF